MPRRSLFEIIFGTNGNKPLPQKYQTLSLLNGNQAIWTNPDSNIYNNDQIRACIDAIARNGAKLNPKHIRYSYDNEGNEKVERIYGRVQRLISRKPNEMMKAYDFYYKIISQVELYNNAFVYIRRNDKGEPVGLYPIKSNQYQLLQAGNDIYIQFWFNSGQKYVASLQDDVIHIKRFFCEDDILGGNNVPITKVMSIQHIINEGITNAIKTTQSIKGILKSEKGLLKPEDTKKMRDTFVKDFTDSESGIGALDSTMDFKEVNITPTTATEGQIKKFDDGVFNYYGVNQDILQSKYDEQTFTAFYESKLEPYAVQFSQEFTNKIFSPTEIYHGNEIVFEANRLNYASNTTKANIVKVLLYYGVIKKNEAREIFNLAPTPDGNVYPQSLATNIDIMADNNNDSQEGK